MVDEGVDALTVEEVLDALAILALPVAVGTTPLIVEGDVHRHPPGVIAEVAVAVAAWCLRLCLLPLLLTLLALWLSRRPARETGHLQLTAVVLAHVGIQTCLGMDGLMQKLTALPCTLIPEVAAPVVGPPCPHFVEGWDMVGGVGVALSEPIRSKGDELGLRVDEEHLLWTRLLRSAKAAKSTSLLGLVFLGLYAVEDMLGFGLVVDACVVAPLIGGEKQGGDEIEFAVGGGSLGIARAIGLATPSEVALADAVLVLHVFLAPAPQAVEDVFLAKLHGNHQPIRHALGAHVVVLDVGDVAHGVSHLEIHLVGTVEHVVEDFLQLLLHFIRTVAHLSEEVTVLARFKRTFFPGALRAHRPLSHCHEGKQNGNENKQTVSFHLMVYTWLFGVGDVAELAWGDAQCLLNLPVEGAHGIEAGIHGDGLDAVFRVVFQQTEGAHQTEEVEILVK